MDFFKEYIYNDFKDIIEQKNTKQHIFRKQILNDNLFVFYVLQHLNQLIYLDIPLYHYIIGRNNQTVNKRL